MEQITDTLYKWGIHDEQTVRQIIKCNYDGRVFGRMQAKGKFKRILDSSGNKTEEFECVREPLVKKEDMKKWIEEKGVELRGGDVDESPHCYKRLAEVLDFHKDTIKIIHTLTPIGVCMSPSGCRDPYKD